MLFITVYIHLESQQQSQQPATPLSLEEEKRRRAEDQPPKTDVSCAPGKTLNHSQELRDETERLLQTRAMCKAKHSMAGRVASGEEGPLQTHIFSIRAFALRAP